VCVNTLWVDTVSFRNIELYAEGIKEGKDVCVYDVNKNNKNPNLLKDLKWTNEDILDKAKTNENTISFKNKKEYKWEIAFS